MIAARRFSELADMASERLGCHVDPTALQGQCDRFEEIGHPRWTDATYTHWLLCRGVEAAAVRWLSMGATDIRFSCELHVFAINFHETPEQLERLRNENTSRRAAEYARSKLTKKQARRVRPVDRVAHNVAPFPIDDAGGDA